MAAERTEAGGFPVAAGILFGLGLGGFFDGIVLHQVLQWHHMLSGWYPIVDLESLRLNTLWDGIFHSATYVFVVLGLFVLWRHARRRPLNGSDRPLWSNRLLAGSLLVGFGAFNLVEGIVDHHILGIHRVNETVADSARLAFDLGFLAWGAAMLAGGWVLMLGGPDRSAP